MPTPRSEGRLAPIRGELRGAEYRRVSHGLFLPVAHDATPREEWLRDLAAWRLVLPDDGVFTHLTAAALAGWWLPRLPDWMPTFAAVGGEHRGPRRIGLVISRLDREHAPWQADGLPLDAAEEVLLRCARDLATLDLVPLIESALRLGHVDRPTLARVCLTSRPGVRALRRGVDLADERSESLWETLLRIFHVCIDIPVEPQVDLFDDGGEFVARADLLVNGTLFVHEYDGDDHRDRRVHRRDLRRERRLADSRYSRRGYTADELLNHSLTMLAEMDRELGRPFRPERVRSWRRLLAYSSYSATGRDRLRNRWMRRMGITDWSRTA